MHWWLLLIVDHGIFFVGFCCWKPVLTISWTKIGLCFLDMLWGPKTNTGYKQKILIQYINTIYKHNICKHSSKHKQTSLFQFGILNQLFMLILSVFFTLRKQCTGQWSEGLRLITNCHWKAFCPIKIFNSLFFVWESSLYICMSALPFG